MMLMCWCASATDWCWYFHPYHILKLVDPIWDSEMLLHFWNVKNREDWCFFNEIQWLSVSTSFLFEYQISLLFHFKEVLILQIIKTGNTAVGHSRITAPATIMYVAWLQTFLGYFVQLSGFYWVCCLCFYLGQLAEIFYLSYVSHFSSNSFPLGR